MTVNRLDTRGRSVIAVVSTPPPITGQALASRILIDAFERDGVDHQIISTASALGTDAGGAMARIRSTLTNAGRMARSRHGTAAPVLYIQLGQGAASILRDTAFLAVAAGRRWPVVAHVHGGGWRSALDSVPRPARAVYLRLLKRAETLIALTPSLAAMFDGVIDGDRVLIIGNTVEPSLATLASTAPARWANPPTIAFVSNLLPEKGIDTVLGAAAIAAERQLDMRFVLAGHDPLGRANDLPPNTTWVGVVDGEAKHRLLADAQAFVLPTTYRVEGEPISILEALHVGLPVVTCDQGGITDIVSDANGRLIEADDPAVLLRTLEELTADQTAWEQISATNRRAATRHHGAERHIAALYAALGITETMQGPI